MRAIYDVPAPAKLNLFLHVTGRKPDGYHLIESVFMLIDWCDTLHFEARSDGQISRHDVTDTAESPLPTQIPAALPDDDLTTRAAKALQKATGTSLGVDISLIKRIPAQAGMGGGSSDAASCLLALQRLWGVKVPASKLLQIALSIGADVPFFLSGGNAFVSGVGEVMEPICLPSANFLVVKTASGLSTAEIFNAPSLKRDSETATILGFAANKKCQDETVFGFGRNDLQPVAQQLCEPMNQSLDWLKANKFNGRMTGSGSAVFAHMPHEMDISVIDADSMGNWKIRKCGNLERHPLAGW